MDPILRIILNSAAALVLVLLLLRQDVVRAFQAPDYPLQSTTIRDGTRAGFDVDAVLGNLRNYTVRFKML